MRVGILCYPTYGGSGAVATEMGRALAEAGHTVHLFSYASPFRMGAAPRGLHFHQAEVFTYPLFRYPSYDLALASCVVEVARREGLDVLHAHYAVPHAVSALLARESLGEPGPAVVTTLHGTDVTLVGAESSYGPVIRWSLSRSDAVTAVSRHLADATTELFAPDAEIRVVPNFVDTERFRPRDGDRGSWVADDGPTLIHLSNFRPVKRPLDVVETFARVREELPARLVLAGEGPELPVVRNRVRALGLTDSVVFAGEVRDVPGLLQGGDAFLLASDSESFGLAALEAMACGLPVVSTDGGGIAELVRDGETGLLAPTGDVEALATACLDVLSTPERAAGLGEEGRRRSESDYAMDDVIGLYESIYTEVAP